MCNVLTVSKTAGRVHHAGELALHIATAGGGLINEARPDKLRAAPSPFQHTASFKVTT
jgi:hypothetical protein